MAILWRCGGLVVSVSASRPPILGSNLGPGPLQSAGAGRQIHTVLRYTIQIGCKQFLCMYVGMPELGRILGFCFFTD